MKQRTDNNSRYVGRYERRWLRARRMRRLGVIGGVAMTVAGTAFAAGGGVEAVSAAADKVKLQKSCFALFKEAEREMKDKLDHRKQMLQSYRDLATLPDNGGQTKERLEKMLPAPLSFHELTVADYQPIPEYSTENSVKYWRSPTGGAAFVEGKGDPQTCAIGLHIADGSNPDLEMVAVFMPAYLGMEPRSALVGAIFPTVWNWGIDPKADAWAKDNIPKYFAKFKKAESYGRWADEIQLANKGGMDGVRR